MTHFHEPTNWKTSIGQRADIVAGEAVLSADGFLTVSKTVAPYTLLIQERQVIPVCPPDEYRGRAYRFMRADCASLVVEWMDRNYGTNMVEQLRQLVGRRYQELNRFGYEDVVREFGFVEAGQPMHGDLIFYERMGHIGVCLDGSKILHHPNGKFSCIDAFDQSKALKVYRYAQ